MIRLIYKLSVIIGRSTKISITLGGSTWIVAVRGDGTCDLQDRWIRSTRSNPIWEKYFPDGPSSMELDIEVICFGKDLEGELCGLSLQEDNMPEDLQND